MRQYKGVKLPASLLKGAKGEQAVENILSRDFGWYVLPHGNIDFGTDIWAMPVSGERVPSYSMLGIQVKTGGSYFRSPHKVNDIVEGWWFPFTTDHLISWTNGRINHIVVLLDDSCNKAYWAKIDSEAIEKSHKKPRVLVRKDHCLTTVFKDELAEFACLPFSKKEWSGSAWNGIGNLKSEERIRYALLASRAVSPHVNKPSKDMQGYEALASVAYGNEYGVEWSWEMEELSTAMQVNPPQPVPLTKNEAKSSDDWCWRAAEALYEYKVESNTDQISLLRLTSRLPEERAASSILQLITMINEGDWENCLTYADTALTYDDYTDIDRAWLLTWRAWIQFELGAVKAATITSSDAARYCLGYPEDLTSLGLLGACMELMFHANFILTSNERTKESHDYTGDVIQYGDNPIYWWLGNQERAIADSLIDASFKNFTKDKSTTDYANMHTLVTLELQSALIGNRSYWKRYRTRLGKLLFSEALSNHDEKYMQIALENLRSAANHRDFQQGLYSAKSEMTRSFMEKISNSLDLSKSTQSTAFNDLTLAKAASNCMTSSKADTIAKWCMSTILRPEEWARKVRPTFIYIVEILKVLSACYLSTSQPCKKQIHGWFVHFPTINNQLTSQEFYQLIRQFPQNFWKTKTLKKLIRRRDSKTLCNFYERQMSLLDEEYKQIRHAKLSNGDFTLIQSIKDVEALTRCESKAIAKNAFVFLDSRIEQYNKMSVKSHGTENLAIFSIIAVGLKYHQSVDWNQVAAILENPAFFPESKIPALNLIAAYGKSLPVSAKQLLKESLMVFARNEKTNSELFQDENTDSQKVAFEAAASLSCTKTQKIDILNETIDKQLFDSAARIIGHNNLHQQVPILMMLLAMPETNRSGAAARALTQLILHDHSNDYEIHELHMLVEHGTLLQQQNIAVAILEESEYLSKQTAWIRNEILRKVTNPLQIQLTAIKVKEK
ncbi:hypothetical protein KIM372_08150 [Bombiscardovia nodaiensis]|uniref:DUF4365 domain-containing protein n=1 Tax=Bombiscardovia nodaiensis TaxID=2932181 RepID=A0ABM8B7Y0_9BIFI|nr:hypothetical protein KIM372_08150 [Bombiscardovia nodaiensis]